MNLIFLGPPGAGKGTIAIRIKDIFSIPHISTGDIFRAAIKNETPLGQQVKSILAAGNLVTDQVTIELVEERLTKEDTLNGYILDGFPRTIPQAEAMETFSHIDYVINFEIDREAIIRRLSGRRIAKESGRIYHILYGPPKREGFCDVSGEPLIQRDDDKEEAIINRLDVYKKQTKPLIDYYTAKGLVKNIDASPSPEAVTNSLIPLLKR
jgi:adenylate kinase